jgi:hypothetical protein
MRAWMYGIAYAGILVSLAAGAAGYTNVGLAVALVAALAAAASIVVRD